MLDWDSVAAGGSGDRRPGRPAKAAAFAALLLMLAGWPLAHPLAQAQPEAEEGEDSEPGAESALSANLLALVPESAVWVAHLQPSRLLRRERVAALAAAALPHLEQLLGAQPLAVQHLLAFYDARLSPWVTRLGFCVFFSETLHPFRPVLVCEGALEGLEAPPALRPGFELLAAPVDESAVEPGVEPGDAPYAEIIDGRYLLVAADPDARQRVRADLAAGVVQDLTVSRTLGGVALDRSLLVHAIALVPPDLVEAVGAELLLNELIAVELRVAEQTGTAGDVSVRAVAHMGASEAATRVGEMLQLLLASWVSELPDAQRAALELTRERVEGWVSVDGPQVSVELDETALPSLLSPALPPLVLAERRSRAAQAPRLLEVLTQAVLDFYDRGGELPRATGLVPEGVPCGRAASPDPEVWDAAGWESLGFRPEEPLYYAYQVLAEGTGADRSLVLRAHGDLDCDAVLSLYQRTIGVGPEGTVVGDLEVEEGLE